MDAPLPQNQSDQFAIEEEDGEAIILQGFRRTRQSTNWLHRGTALTTTNQLDIRALEVHAMDLEDALHYVVGAFVTATMVARTRFQEGATAAHRKMKSFVEFLSLSIAWIICSIELIYLDIQDTIWCVHTALVFTEPRLRSIDSIIDDNHCEELFGFKINELELLLEHLRIPMVFRRDGYLFTGEEAMLIYFHYIRTATPFTRSARHVFGGDPRRFTLYIRSMVEHLYNTFYHRISGYSMVQWMPYVNQFRRAIHDKLMSGLIGERRDDGSVEASCFRDQEEDVVVIVIGVT